MLSNCNLLWALLGKYSWIFFKGSSLGLFPNGSYKKLYDSHMWTHDIPMTITWHFKIITRCFMKLNLFSVIHFHFLLEIFYELDQISFYQMTNVHINITINSLMTHFFLIAQIRCITYIGICCRLVGGVSYNITTTPTYWSY